MVSPSRYSSTMPGVDLDPDVVDPPDAAVELVGALADEAGPSGALGLGEAAASCAAGVVASDYLNDPRDVIVHVFDRTDVRLRWSSVSEGFACLCRRCWAAVMGDLATVTEPVLTVSRLSWSLSHSPTAVGQ